MTKQLENTMPKMNRYILMFIAIWSVVFLVSVIFIASEIHVKAKNQAFIRAKSIAERDMLYRKWASSFEGLYVKVTDQSQPNPLLGFMHNRDIEAKSGETLTLMSPASMTRQVYDLSNENSDFINRITSLDLLNSDNAPDTWESAALKRLGQGDIDSYSSLVSRDGVKYARTLIPLKTDASCLGCHFDKGYKVGDIRGGISVLIPFAPFHESAWSDSVRVIAMAVMIWFVGLIVIFLFSKKLKQQFVRISESERQRNLAESTLHYLAHFDKKTNLPNRALFEDRLNQAIAYGGRLTNKVAIAVVRIDNFDQINDTSARPIEDVLIRSFAEIIGMSIRPDDTIARFGKNSLMLLLPGIVAQENIARIVDKINTHLESPVIVEEQEVFINSSFGVSFYPDDSSDPVSLIRFAETAAERACSLERTNLQMYSADLNEMAHEHLFLETGMRRALKEGQFAVHYQPQIDAPSGRIIGAEALIRWFHPDRGLISPDMFIPLAENNGMIFSIGEWVMRTACQQAVMWQRSHNRPFQIGVNVSAKQFQDPNLVDIIDSILAETGLAPENLEIEITEGVIMHNVERAIETLVDLKVRGIKIAIDDFGTGYSSLSHLKKFPIDRLKIDRSFVSDLAVNNDDQVIVEMIIELTGKLHHAVIAEGVESKAQQDFLISRGCYHMQGFLFGRPVSAEDFVKVLDVSV